MSVKALITKTGKLFRSATIAFCCGYCFVNFVAEPILCSGPSMEPTIHDKDIIIADRFTSAFLKHYERGDIIIARSPSNPENLICKRVVGVSGDIVKQGFLSQQVVPRGHVWLHGDNTTNSTDSRDFGALPVGLIQGKAIAKIWPPNDISFFK